MINEKKLVSVRGKNNFAEVSKNLATDLKVFLFQTIKIIM